MEFPRRQSQSQEVKDGTQEEEEEEAEEESAAAASEDSREGSSSSDDEQEPQEDDSDSRIAEMEAKAVEDQALIKKLTDGLAVANAMRKRKAEKKQREQQALLAQQTIQRLRAELAAAEQEQAMGGDALQASSSSVAAERAPAQRAAAPLAAAAAASSHRPPQPKLGDMVSWDGSAKTLIEWLANVERAFMFYKLPEHEKVGYAIIRTTGPPWDWWKSEKSLPDSTALTWTWEEYLARLRARFVSVISSDVAREQLHTLHQGRALTTEYIDSFRKLINLIPDMGPADQLAQFMRGLQSSIATQLRILNVKTLAAAIEAAVRIGGIQQQGAAAAQGPQAAAMHAMDLDQNQITTEQYHHLMAMYRDHGLRGTAPPSLASSSSGAPREWVPKPLPVIPGMSPAEVKSHMKEHKCFTCHETGHRSFGCPKKAKKGNQ